VAAGVVPYLALRDGVVAGGASFRIAQGVAQLTGAATAPAYRRHGVHSALLSVRLADAAAAGCDIAVVTTSRDRSHRRTCSVGASICSIPARHSSSSDRLKPLLWTKSSGPV
jgi:GNAT superfamily N-acetyltransferase